MMGKPTDVSGQKFGHLTAIKRVGYRKYPGGGGLSIWECKCDCGNTTQVTLSALRTGNTTSCGCAGSRNSMGDRTRTHGMTHSRLNVIWKRMKRRCKCPNIREYKWYGAKGVSVCDEWDKSFEAFYEWSMKNGYDPSAPRGVCTIDRINPFGNYEPSNCRWVSMEEQRRNKRVDYLNRRLQESSWEA